MLKTKAKAPVVNKPTTPSPSVLKSTALKRKPAPEPEVQEPDESGEGEAEPDPEPEPTPLRKAVKRVGAAPEPVQTKKSLADLFDSTKPKGFFPIGEFTGYVAAFKMVGEIADDIDDQGPLTIIATYEAHEDETDPESGESLDSKTIDNRYTIVNKQGEFNEVGSNILKQDLVKLGYDEADCTFENLEEILKQVTAERPLVVFKTVSNPPYVNAYLQGLAQTE